MHSALFRCRPSLNRLLCSSYNSVRNIYQTSVCCGLTGYKRGENLVTTQAARDFIYMLAPEERVLLLDELQIFQKASEAENNPDIPPTSDQLRAVALHNAMPFIGFGFLDNFIMIVCGDYIDATIGLTLGISTMAAAGLGNAFSDVAGIGSAWYVEQISSKIGVRAPELTPAQIGMKRTRWSAHLGRALGVTVGCLLGMFPLLFLPGRVKAMQGTTEEQAKG